MSEVNETQQAVLNQLLTNFRAGGVEACQAMVNDLAAEVAMAAAVSGGTEEVRHEVILAQEDMTIEEIVANIETLNGISTATAEAMSRYSFALYLLTIVKKGLKLG